MADRTSEHIYHEPFDDPKENADAVRDEPPKDHHYFVLKKENADAVRDEPPKDHPYFVLEPQDNVVAVSKKVEGEKEKLNVYNHLVREETGKQKNPSQKSDVDTYSHIVEEETGKQKIPSQKSDADTYDHTVQEETGKQKNPSQELDEDDYDHLNETDDVRVRKEKRWAMEKAAKELAEQKSKTSRDEEQFGPMPSSAPIDDDHAYASVGGEDTVDQEHVPSPPIVPFDDTYASVDDEDTEVQLFERFVAVGILVLAFFNIPLMFANLIKYLR